MIPKVIHYCWFGGNPLPKSAGKYIESWKKCCPGYEIRRWDESSIDVSSCTYAREAYEAGKWAFVSDYARFLILYRYGGIYFDTDVELIRPIEDILERGAFMGLENNASGEVNPGLGLAAPAGHPLLRELLDKYESRHFIREDGSINFTTVVAHTTEVLQRHGEKSTERIKCVGDIYLYPNDYFCPLNYLTMQMKITDNTRSIHHFAASWKRITWKAKLANRVKKVAGPVITRKILDFKAKRRARRNL